MKCSIARALDEVGERWSLLIVHECMLGTTRFDEFRKRLGIARNILTTRLARLIERGIVERCCLTPRARVGGYRLTEKGRALSEIIGALAAWGDRWVPPVDDAGDPRRVVERHSERTLQ